MVIISSDAVALPYSRSARGRRRNLNSYSLTKSMRYLANSTNRSRWNWTKIATNTSIWATSLHSECNGNSSRFVTFLGGPILESTAQLLFFLSSRQSWSEIEFVTNDSIASRSSLSHLIVLGLEVSLSETPTYEPH